MTPPGSRRLVVAGLFAGIGGIEEGFRRADPDGFECAMLCEAWEPAARVLSHQFPGTSLHPDVRTLRRFSTDIDVVTAGFPCTDLSQAGRTAGITGDASGLVSHVFAALRRHPRRRLPTLVIENVTNMLVLDGGRAMRYLVDEIEALGYRWAYRTVDSRFTGVPQRRRRVLLVASRVLDPVDVLFADDAGPPVVDGLSQRAFGFYWTEGRSGLGWAQDAIPTLKGGSTIGIPSPPAIWMRNEQVDRRFVAPCIEHAERLQGFPAGWTSAGGDGRREGARWKMVGNAVTVGVAEWLGRRLISPRPVAVQAGDAIAGRWPGAAAGARGQAREMLATEWPELHPYTHLLDVVDAESARPLSHRAIGGFWNRLQSGNLGRHPGFRADVVAYLRATEPEAALGA